MDAAARWWTNAELNSYIESWQDKLQCEFEFDRGYAVSTLTASTSLVNFTSEGITDIGRIDAIYCNQMRLTPTSQYELEELNRDWRATAERGPGVFVPMSHDEILLWPPVGTAGAYLELEYPTAPTFVEDSSASIIPGYTRYSAIDYICYRAYLRPGVNNNLNRALRRKAQFDQKLGIIRSIKQAAPATREYHFKPASRYEYDILKARRRSPAVPAVTISLHNDEIPGGAVNGTNSSFTLTYAPAPTISLKLSVDGIGLKQSTHYTLSGTNVTFVSAFIPISGQAIFASYRYSG
jgi:hypothetical protein